MTPNRQYKKMLAAKFGRICLRCRKAFSLKELTLDHVRPRADGGATAFYNLQLLCAPCNGEKGATKVDYR